MKWYWILLSVSLLAVLDWLYLAMGEKRRSKAHRLAVKAMGTLIPVLISLIAILRFPGPESRWLLVAALCICLVADVVIGLNFIAGMLVFLAAHLFLIVYYLSLAPFQWQSILVFGVLYGAVVAFFWRFIPKLGKRLVPFAVYPAVLMAMFSIAALLPFSVPVPGVWIIAAGALLFCVSDIILGYTQINGSSSVTRCMVMILYYPAVYCLGLSGVYMV